jgi:RimJ/RimL family protein N-acetyltransferase
MPTQPPDPWLFDRLVLDDHRVRLEPLEARHAADLARVIDGPTFEFMRVRPERFTPEGVLAYVEQLRARPAQCALAVVPVGPGADGRAVGTTSYAQIQPEHRTLEIGYTWIAPVLRGSGLNRSMKLLMLRHAFETLRCVRVELRTDERNARSRRAIEKLGATLEGILRHHMLLPDGHRRSSAVYSILAAEWPRSRAMLGA